MARGGPAARGRTRRSDAGRLRAPGPPGNPAPPLPLGHPALIAAALVAAGCIAFSVTYRIFDTDFWQHLLVGKAIWATRSIPRVNLWSWPTWGAPDVNYAWGFEALVWPFWRLGGTVGLFVWRWSTTLAAFGILWATARRLGARGLTPLVVMALCALLYRQRSQVRPETLVAPLLALELYVLEGRRLPAAGGKGLRDPAVWLPLIALAWANVHLSLVLGFALIGIHLVADSRARAGRDPAASRDARRRLWLAALGALVCSLVNPFGPRALAQPFEYVAVWRHEPIYQSILELRPITWAANLRNGLPLVVFGWPALLLWRARAAGFDLVEALTCASFTGLALSSNRFLGFYALVAAPYLARDLEAWLRARRWPAWTAPAWARATLASTACLMAGIPEWTLPEPRPGIGIEMKTVPVGACDFIAARGVRGRGFNSFEIGGYELWRFWPDRGRLPFMDVHQAGSREDRRGYAEAFLGRDGWLALDRRYRFDFVLLPREQPPGTRLLDELDADSTFCLVFADDAAALFVRRPGPLAALAESDGYRVLPAGHEGIDRVARAAEEDPAVRALVRAEVGRRIAASPFNASASMVAAWFAALEGRSDEARRHLERAVALDPRLPSAHLRLGMLALDQNRPREALLEIEREKAISGDQPVIELGLGRAWARLGDPGRARRAYRRALTLEPGSQEARDSLAALEADGRR